MSDLFLVRSDIPIAHSVHYVATHYAEYFSFSVFGLTTPLVSGKSAPTKSAHIARQIRDCEWGIYLSWLSIDRKLTQINLLAHPN